MQAIYTRTMRVKDDMLGKAMEIGQGLAKVRKKYVKNVLCNFMRILIFCR